MSDQGPPSHESHASGSHYQPAISVVVIIIVLFVGATYLMVRTVTPSSSSPTTTTTSSSSSTTTLPRIVRSKVRVQVANGTTIPGLAGNYTQKLMTEDWDTLPPGNAPKVKATIVYFTPGHQRAALEIASIIKVSSSVVHPLGKERPIAGSTTDDVIVVLGRNSKIS